MSGIWQSFNKCELNTDRGQMEAAEGEKNSATAPAFSQGPGGEEYSGKRRSDLGHVGKVTLCVNTNKVQPLWTVPN